MSLRTPIPVIETERLILRGPRDAALPASAQYFTTPRADFTGGQRGEVEPYTMLMILAGHWHMRGYGLWVIEHRETGPAARAYAAGDLGSRAPSSFIDPRNDRSAALATRLGATSEKRSELRGTPIDIWRHPDVTEAAA